MSIGIQIEIAKNSYKIEYNTSCLTNKEDKTTKIFGYCRVSSDLQKNNDSIDGQIKNIENNCLWRKTTLVAIYVDDGISGKNMIDRPGFMEMLKDIEEFHVPQSKMLCVYTNYLSRLTRNADDMSFLCKEFCRMKVDLNSFDCPCNIRDKSSHYILGIMAGQNELQRIQIAENVKNIMRGLSESGNLICKKYGYALKEIKIGDKTKNISIAIPREQEAIEKILELWEESGRKSPAYVIARELNSKYKDEFYYKEEDRLWTPPRVERILYKKKLSLRNISEPYPIHLKDEKMKDEIIKMINDGLFDKGPVGIARKLDDLCIFKHQITPNYVIKILAEMGSGYTDAIDKNLKSHIEKIRNIVTEMKKMTYEKLIGYLNENQIYNTKNKKWTYYSFVKFCEKYKIKRNK